MQGSEVAIRRLKLFSRLFWVAPLAALAVIVTSELVFRLLHLTGQELQYSLPSIGLNWILLAITYLIISTIFFTLKLTQSRALLYGIGASTLIVALLRIPQDLRQYGYVEAASTPGSVSPDYYWHLPSTIIPYIVVIVTGILSAPLAQMLFSREDKPEL